MQRLTVAACLRGPAKPARNTDRHKEDPALPAHEGKSMNDDRIYWIGDVQLAAQHLPDPDIAQSVGKMEYVVSVSRWLDPIPVMGTPLPYGPDVRIVTVLFRLVAWRKGEGSKHWRWEVGGRVVIGEPPA
jgi:hypothetical protein